MISDLLNPTTILTIIASLGILFLFYNAIKLALIVIENVVKSTKLTTLALNFIIILLLFDIIVETGTALLTGTTVIIEMTLIEASKSRDLVLDYLADAGLDLNQIPETQVTVVPVVPVPVEVVPTATPQPTEVPQVAPTPVPTLVPTQTVGPTIDISAWTVGTPVPTRKPFVNFNGTPASGQGRPED